MTLSDYRLFRRLIAGEFARQLTLASSPDTSKEEKAVIALECKSLLAVDSRIARIIDLRFSQCRTV